MFDPDDFQGRLRACPFLGTWRALLYEEVMRLERMVAICSVFWWINESRLKNLQEVVQANYLRRTYSGQSLFPPQRLVRNAMSGYGNWKGGSR